MNPAKTEIPETPAPVAPELPKDCILIIRDGCIRGWITDWAEDDALVLDTSTPSGFNVVKMEKEPIIKLATAGVPLA